MRRPIARSRIRPTLTRWVAALSAWAGLCGVAHAQTSGPAPDPPRATAVEERLRRLEDVNAQLLKQLDRDRDESARRYRELENRCLELKRQLGEPRPATGTEPEGPREEGGDSAGRT